MKIDASLKLVIERRRESDGKPFYVYANAVSRNTAEQFWQVIQTAVGKLYFGGGNPTIAPKFAANAVRRAADELGVREDVDRFFLAEIRRLATVVTPGETGWESAMFDEAAKTLSEDEVDEIESALCFFTLAWRFHSTNDRRAVISGAVTLWGARTTSSTFMEFVGSLPTLKETAASGETTPPEPPTLQKEPAALSVPS